MSMLPRLKPKCFYDLVIEVAIVRPGPIQGDMVHPYLRRRNGEEEVVYPSKELEEILGRTLGVPLFQEQAMEIAIVAGGFTPAEADELRRSMATFKAKGKVSAFEKKLIAGMIKKGYTEEFSKRVFRQLEGFGGYGFPESHAASFALLVYVSSWMKCYYPDVFAAALLNSMPMGFYQQGLKEEDMQILVAARDAGFVRIPQLLDAGVPLSALEHLADADAFRSIGLDRRKALWEVAALTDHAIGLFHGQQQDTTAEKNITLPEMSVEQHVIEDYRTLALSLKAHPISFVRDQLAALNVISNASLMNCKDGTNVRVAGLVLIRQRPGTASGIVFVTIEDETGTSNLVVFSNLFAKYRKEIVHSHLLMVEGKMQKEGEVIHVVVQRCYNLSGLLAPLSQPKDTDYFDKEEPGDNSPAKRKKKAVKPVQTDIFHGGRNFH